MLQAFVRHVLFVLFCLVGWLVGFVVIAVVFPLKLEYIDLLGTHYIPLRKEICKKKYNDYGRTLSHIPENLNIHVHVVLIAGY